MEIKRVFDLKGNSWEIGKYYFGKESKINKITDRTHWEDNEGGWHRGIPYFVLSFDDGTSVGLYTSETIFSE